MVLTVGLVCRVKWGAARRLPVRAGDAKDLKEVSGLARPLWRLRVRFRVWEQQAVAGVGWELRACRLSLKAVTGLL